MGEDAVGALVADHVGVDRQQAPVGVGGGADRDRLVAGVAGGEQVLGPVLDPADRAAEPQRQPGDEDFLGIGVALLAERPADVGAAHPRRAGLQPEQLGGHLGEPVGSLARGPDQDPVGLRDRQRAAALHRSGRVAGVAEVALDDDRGGVEGRVDLAFLEVRVVEDVGLLEEERRVRLA